MYMPSAPEASPTPPPSTWKVQVLTPAYLLEGYLPPLEHLWQYLTQPDNHPSLTLASVQVQALTNTAVAPRAVSSWTMPVTSLVAFIPRDAASTAAAEQIMLLYQYTFSVVVYAGSYRIRTTLLSDDPEPLASPIMIATEAEITYQLGQQHLPRLRARLLLLRRQWVHGYHAA
jgi:hypothetical protein